MCYSCIFLVVPLRIYCHIPMIEFPFSRSLSKPPYRISESHYFLGSCNVAQDSLIHCRSTKISFIENATWFILQILVQNTNRGTIRNKIGQHTFVSTVFLFVCLFLSFSLQHSVLNCQHTDIRSLKETKCPLRRSLSKALYEIFELHLFYGLVTSTRFQSHCGSTELDLGKNLPFLRMFVHND